MYHSLRLTVFALASLIYSCAHSSDHDSEHHHTDATQSEHIEQDVALTDSLEANRYDNIYFSAQPEKSDWQKLKDQGFTTIINLRSPREYDEKEERETLASLGMTYHNVAFEPRADLDDTYIDEVTKHVMANRKKGKILIHCASGARVGIWLAGHFYKDHGMSKDEALATAKALGLDRPGAIEKAQKYLSNQAEK
ncbi:MAG: hypothetical protein ACOH5I_06870 [Oligoflexus sp.]